MLLKSKITNVEIHTETWLQERLGRFTASNIHKIMGDRGIGQTGMSYIRGRVYEEISGLSAEKDISTFEIEWGHEHEPAAVRRFGEMHKLEFLVQQKLIKEPGSRFGCTPDALWVINESPDETAYNVHTIEIKCFQGVHHVEMCECATPEDIKKTDPKVYWQVIDQMLICDALRGYAGFYNPTMRFADFHTVEFRKANLLKDFVELKVRKQQALEIFDSIRNKLLSL